MHLLLTCFFCFLPHTLWCFVFTPAHRHHLKLPPRNALTHRLSEEECCTGGKRSVHYLAPSPFPPNTPNALAAVQAMGKILMFETETRKALSVNRKRRDGCESSGKKKKTRAHARHQATNLPRPNKLTLESARCLVFPDGGVCNEMGQREREGRLGAHGWKRAVKKVDCFNRRRRHHSGHLRHSGERQNGRTNGRTDGWNRSKVRRSLAVHG